MSFNSNGYLIGPNTPIVDGLMLYLDPANETSYNGSGTWNDLSGLGNDFTPENGISNADLQEANYYNSWKLDPTNEKFKIDSNIYFLPGTSNFTIQMWINRDSSTRLECFFAKGGGQPNTFLMATTDGMSGGDFIRGEQFAGVIQYSNTRFSQYATTSLTAGVWRNLTWAFSRTANKMYINGEEATTDYGSGDSDDWDTNTTLNNSYSVEIGGLYTRGYDYYWSSSAIGPVFFYNRQLSAEEVKHNYQLHANRFG